MTHYREPGAPYALCGKGGTWTSDLGAADCVGCFVVALEHEGPPALSPRRDTAPATLLARVSGPFGSSHASGRGSTRLGTES